MSGAAAIRLAQEVLDRRIGMSQVHLDYVRANGLELPNLGYFDPICFCGYLVVTPIRRVGKDRFDFAEPDEPNEQAAVVECFGRDGETTIDLVAWPVDRPDVILTMFGAASMLGLWQAMNPYSYTFNRPLVLHKHPLAWLQAGCDGAAVVDWRLATRDLLDLPGKFAVPDHEYGREMLRRVSSALSARMLIPRERRNAG